MNKSSTVIVAIVALFLLAILGPFLTIWSWNVLFGSVHTIEFSFDSWLAVIILGAFFNARVKSK